MTVNRKIYSILFIVISLIGLLIASLFVYKYRHSFINKERWFSIENLDESWDRSTRTFHRNKTNQYQSNEELTYLALSNTDSTILPNKIYSKSYTKDILIEDRSTIQEIRVCLNYPLGFTLRVNDTIVIASPNIFSLNLNDSITFSTKSNTKADSPIEYFSFSPKTLNRSKVNIQLNFYYLDSSLIKNEADFRFEIKKGGFYVASPLFSAREQIVTESTIDIPRIFISTNNIEIPDEPKIKGHLKVVDNKGNTKDFNIRIEKRGHSSQNHNFEKNSYTIKLYDKRWNKTKASLLGLTPDSDWVLYAPYFDKTLIRNALSFELGKITSSYCPTAKMCEVYVNHTFKGIYYLIEKIEIGKSRVNLSYKESQKGFLAQIDRYETENNEFGFFYRKINQNYSYSSIVYPKPNKLTINDKIIIKKQLTHIDSLFKWHSHSNEVWNHVDLNSFVDFFIISEISRNPDAYRLSTYMHNANYLDPKSKLIMGPIWDFNLAFGNSILAPGYTGWAFDIGKETDQYLMVNWWKNAFLNNSEFQTILKKKWILYRNRSFSNQKITHLIDSLSSEGPAAKERNFTAFKILDKQLWWNPYVGGNYENEIDYLKYWTENRLRWLDVVLEN